MYQSLIMPKISQSGLVVWSEKGSGGVHTPDSPAYHGSTHPRVQGVVGPATPLRIPTERQTN